MNLTGKAKDVRQENGKGPIHLLWAAGQLKNIRRSGWISKAKIQNPESVADHCFRMAILGAYLGEELHLDSQKLVRMCLIHDLAESEMGDLMPEEKISERDHRVKEDRVVKRILATLPKGVRRLFLRDWKELLAKKSVEAKLTWEIDKLEMGLQMKDYIAEGRSGKALATFDPSRNLSNNLRNILEEYRGGNIGIRRA